MNCEECYWYHEGKENNCWFEHNPSEECGDYEPLNNEEYFELIKVTNYVDWRMKMNKCGQCKYKADFAGNYIECVLLHRFVDYEYWHNEEPEGCQFKAKQENNVDEK